MKRFLLPLLLMAFCGLRVSALTPVPYTEAISFSMKLLGNGSGTMTVYGEGGSPMVSKSGNFKTASESDVGTVWLRPGKEYQMSYSYSGGSEYWLSFTPPEGYEMYVNQKPSDLVHDTQGGNGPTRTYTISLRPVRMTVAAPFGAFSGIALGKSVTWDVGLGSLGTSRNAGRVVFKQYDLTSSPASRANLYYAPPLNYGSIEVIKDGPSNQTLRQVLTPQGLIDFVDDASGGYWMNCYKPSDLEGSPGNPYIIHGTPWKQIRIQSPGTNQLKITETEGTVSRVSLATAGSAVDVNGYTWTVQEGDGTTWRRTVTNSCTTTTAPYDVTAIVRTGGTTGTIVGKTKYHYENLGTGENVLTSIQADPDTAALTTSFTYYTTAPVSGSETNRGKYRKVRAVTQPTGAWSATEFYDDWNRRGEVKYQQSPYVDLPATPPSTIDPNSASSGVVVQYDYVADWTGRYSRATLVQETINGTITGKTTNAWGDNTSSGWPHETLSSTTYRDATNSHVSYVERYRGDAGFDDAGTLYQEYGADQSKTVCNRSTGTYDSNTGLFTYGNGITHNRFLIVHGSTNSSGADSITTWNSQTIPQIYVIANKSTMDVTIRDAAGNIVRTETRIYAGSGNFALFTYNNNTFDIAGRLTQSVTNNGATITNTYTNGRLTSTIDPSGTEIQNTSFDELSRVLTAVKKGAVSRAAVLTSGYNYPAQGDITTTYTYDGASHVTQVVVSGGATTLTTTSQFDLAGRQTQQVDPGNFTTGYGYSSGGKIVTVTLPDTKTKVTETYLDGRPKSVSGTGVVSSSITYGVETSSGRKFQQATAGGYTTSWTKTYTDWLGRVSEESTPGWSGTATSKKWYYNNSGQLWKTTVPGVAPTLYMYDTQGVLYRQGLDVNSNDVLDLTGSDRITESTYGYYIDGMNRAVKQTASLIYTSVGSSTPATVTGTAEYLSNLGAGVLSSVTTSDIFNNYTNTMVTVDRANKLVTTTTDTPDSSVNAVSIAYNGLGVEMRTAANQTTRLEYDAVGRKVKDIDPRTGTTTTAYVSGASLVNTVTDAANYTVATYTYDAAGRVATVTNADGKVTRYEYTARGEKLHEWGDTPYPVEYGYDNVGRQITMKTYRGGTGWTGTTWPTASTGTADTTTWTFDDGTHTGDNGTGLLKSKTDAAGRSVTYTYTQARQLYTRAWARGVTSTYGYDSTTGEQTSITYSDTTPALGYTYNRTGAIATVTDYAGTRTFHYSPTTLTTDDETLPSLYNSGATGRLIKWKYDSTTSGALGRNVGFSLGLSTALTSDNDIGYGYDGYGRFNLLTASLSGAASGTFSYGYASNSNLIGTLTETGSGLLQTRSYEANRDLYSGVATTLPSRNLATYQYTNDALARRTVKIETGEMYARYGTGLVTKYGYNARSEVVSSQTYIGTDPAIATAAAGDALQGRSFYYGYDSIGNRTGTTTNGQASTYTSNNLNQIVSRTTPGYADVSGFAAANATVTVAGQPTTRQFDYFYRQHPLSNTSGPVWATLNVSATAPGGANTNENRMLYLARSLEQFTYDEDGNVKSDGRWDYTWDAENRLVNMTTTTVAANAGIPTQTLQYRYDYLGRRVDKKVYNGATLASETKFVYSSTNWHLLAEYDAMNSNAIIRAYSWGLDLSGSTGGAGGVGGLLAIRDASTAATYLPFYDANGNVFGLVNKSTAAVAATYEYDAFGNTLRASGSSTFADKNPFRFSTKYTDAESQLIYYGYRYYSSNLGRFFGRDPSEEKGGLHLYAFCGNNSVNRYDHLGMWSQADFTLEQLENELWLMALVMPEVTDYKLYFDHENMNFKIPGSDLIGGDGSRLISSDLAAENSWHSSVESQASTFANNAFAAQMATPSATAPTQVASAAAQNANTTATLPGGSKPTVQTAAPDSAPLSLTPYQVTAHTKSGVTTGSAGGQLISYTMDSGFGGVRDEITGDWSLFAPGQGNSCITCHGMNGGGWTGNTNEFSAYLPSTGPNARQGYSTLSKLSSTAVSVVGPSAAAGIARLGVGGVAAGVDTFWAGPAAGAAARDWAEATGGTYLNLPATATRAEITAASLEAAENASGPVTVFQSSTGVNLSSTFVSEGRVLVTNPNVTTITYQIVMSDGTIMTITVP